MLFIAKLQKTIITLSFSQTKTYSIRREKDYHIINKNNYLILTVYHVPSTVLPALHPTLYLILSLSCEMSIVVPILKKKLRLTEGDLLQVAQLVKMEPGPNKDLGDLLSAVSLQW